MLPVLLESPDATVDGYVGNTDLHRSNRNDIGITVNGRWVQDSNLAWAVEKGYGNSLPIGPTTDCRHPPAGADRSRRRERASHQAGSTVPPRVQSILSSTNRRTGESIRSRDRTPASAAVLPPEDFDSRHTDQQRGTRASFARPGTRRHSPERASTEVSQQ